MATLASLYNIPAGDFKIALSRGEPINVHLAILSRASGFFSKFSPGQTIAFATFADRVVTWTIQYIYGMASTIDEFDMLYDVCVFMHDISLDGSISKAISQFTGQIRSVEFINLAHRIGSHVMISELARRLACRFNKSNASGVKMCCWLKDAHPGAKNVFRMELVRSYRDFIIFAFDIYSIGIEICDLGHTMRPPADFTKMTLPELQIARDFVGHAPMIHALITAIISAKQSK